MRPHAWALVCCIGCVAEPAKVSIRRMPIQFADVTGRIVLEPVLFHNVLFTVEVGRDDLRERIRIEPPGIIALGDAVLVRKEPERHFRFEIDGRSYFFRKGAEVFIFAPAPGGTLALRFHGLPVTLVDRPERRFVLVFRKDGDYEELSHGESVLAFDGTRFLAKDGGELPAELRARGVRMPREDGAAGR